VLFIAAKCDNRSVAFVWRNIFHNICDLDKWKPLQTF